GPVLQELRGRPGRHHLRQVRVLGERGLSDRERQGDRTGAGRDADRQWPGRAPARRHGRQRPEAGLGRRHVRQGRPGCAGGRRPADPADRRHHGRRNGNLTLLGFGPMWLARPIYEFLPYLYMLVGVGLLGAAWFIEMSTLPSVFMLVGVLSIMAGLVLWLRRRDYRTRQSEYNSRSLED